MAVGVIGTTAWMLVITVVDARQIDMPYANPPVDLETEAECRMVERAINTKAAQAGVSDRLQAECKEVEYVEVPQHR